MDVVGQLLVDANAASVNHRYEEDNAYVYAWQRPRHTDWSPVELLGAIAGYEYQARKARQVYLPGLRPLIALDGREACEG